VQLDRMRATVIAAKARDFPTIPRAELENAYGDISVDALKRTFGSEMELARFVHEGLRHDALDLAKSAAFRITSSLSGTIASSDSLDRSVLEHEARELLHEFLAELTEEDRKIAYLHFHPDYDWTPRRIADALSLPRTEVKRTLDRVGIRLRRFAALAIAPGALCSHRRPEVLQWQSTGVMPLSLRLHLRRCRRCRSEQHQAILGMRSAILPLVPIASLPATATGAFARLYHAVAVQPSVVRSNEVVARFRKAAPIGGGGGAALAAKLAATTAVVTAGAALHAVSASPSPTRPGHRHAPVLRIHARRAHVAAATAVTAAAPPAATVAKPTPLPLRARTSTSRLTSTQSSAPAATTTTKPPPAPSQNTAAPAPVAYHATSGISSHAARDASSSSPPAPVSAAAGGNSSNSRSDTQSGPAPPGGPPPP
jgi:hypothetical protein